MEIYKKQSLSETFKVYFDKRMIKILLLGAISGFPWVIIGSSLSLWLQEDGLSRSTIGWAGLIFAVYAFSSPAYSPRKLLRGRVYRRFVSGELKA